MHLKIKKFLKLWKLNSILFLLLPILLIGCSSGSRSEWSEVLVEEVHDGDTFIGADKTVYRLFGIDTPEVSDQYNNFEPTDGIEQIYAQAATTLVQKQIEGKAINVKKKSVDVYKRQVVIVSIGSVDLAKLLIDAGLARVAYFEVVNEKSPFYSSEFAYYQELVWVQRRAFEKRLGVWRDPSETKIIFPKN